MAKDFYTKKAMQEGYFARSAYKLKQMNKKYSIIKKNGNILDLGCWPGGWIQASLEVIGDNGSIIGIDMKEVNINNKNFKFHKMDVFDKSISQINKKFDAVISDLAPKTTGIKDLDRHKSFQLAFRAMEIARSNLKHNGNFLVKIFQGEEFIKFLNECKKYFNFVKCDKPLASKKKSVEMYVICKGLK